MIGFDNAKSFAAMMPEPPAYDQASDAWMSMAQARAISTLSESGFNKLRRRLGERFEHRDLQGHVWFYGPCWLPVWYMETHK
ncbi:MAG TPA: hypothetical protein VNT79_08385 [Phycisphaerae bacterium]|nr:hypothetical protein [Phycisphaerae bacterium]